jgi:Flp pilus assembly protein TadD
MAISEARLSTAREAFAAQDCRSASLRARQALRAVASRPEPHEILGWCAIERGDAAAAVRELRRAADFEPNGWRAHYGVSLALAAAGQDPRPSLAEARRRNPLGLEVAEAFELMRRDDPRRWRRAALLAPLPPPT